MRKGIFAGLMIASTCASMSAAVATYNVPAIEGDATQVLQQVIDMAQANPGGAVINLAPGAVYNISRTSATPLLRYVSNTTSVDENFDHGMK